MWTLLRVYNITLKPIYNITVKPPILLSYNIGLALYNLNPLLKDNDSE